MESPVSRVQSIERAFAVLGALGDGPLGVTEVANRVHLPKSTVARLLASLAAEGAVEQLPDGTDYRIGDRLATLAGGVRPARGLIALARPHLVELAGTVGEAAGLSIPDGSLVHYVDQEESQNPVGIRDWIRRARMDGYAWTRDEVAEGISSVAAALADEDGEVIGAIHVHGPSYR